MLSPNEVRMKNITPIVRKKESLLTSDALQRVGEMMKTIRFGSVTLIIQDGQVLQIDKTEKFRLNHGR